MSLLHRSSKPKLLPDTAGQMPTPEANELVASSKSGLNWAQLLGIAVPLLLIIGSVTVFFLRGNDGAPAGSNAAVAKSDEMKLTDKKLASDYFTVELPFDAASMKLESISPPEGSNYQKAYKVTSAQTGDLNNLSVHVMSGNKTVLATDIADQAEVVPVTLERDLKAYPTTVTAAPGYVKSADQSKLICVTDDTNYRCIVLAMKAEQVIWFEMSGPNTSYAAHNKVMGDVFKSLHLL